ncbi:MAG: 50S ribosomal protein L21e [Candidatus Woesearchaeota archaeon]
MVKRIGTARRKTRDLFSVKHKDKGKVSIRNYFQSFVQGDRVLVGVSPTVQEGMPYRRFVGKMGIVKGMQGASYKVMINDHDKSKIILVHPVHLKKLK